MTGEAAPAWFLAGRRNLCDPLLADCLTHGHVTARGKDQGQHHLAHHVFRLEDHTADLAIAATAGSRDEVLGEAALGLTAVLTGRADPHHLGRPDQEVRFVVEAPDQDALAVAFLSELLWLHESEDLLWLGGGVTVSPGAGGTLRVTAKGNAAKHDPARHGRGVEVKAVTYHGLRFGRTDAGWELWVLLDI